MSSLTRASAIDAFNSMTLRKTKGAVISFSVVSGESSLENDLLGGGAAYDDADYLAAMKAWKSEHAAALAERARKTMALWLSPGYQRLRIGYSGKASQNLEVRLIDTADGVAGAVIEGSKTESNKFIRTGRGGNSSAGMSADDVIAWAKAKGIKARTLRDKKGRFRKSSASEREHSMAYAIMRGIREKGTSSSYKRRFGSRGYDYISKYASGRARTEIKSYMRPYAEGKKRGAAGSLEEISFTYISSKIDKAIRRAAGSKYSAFKENTSSVR